MKTLIISSSLSDDSKSYILCSLVYEKISSMKITAELIDARELELVPYHRKRTADMEKLKKKIKDSDNYVIGMGVHNYSINDSLKIILDTCFDEESVSGKFFGIVAAGGGAKSYLATTHLTQACMNEWHMIQLPRVVYAVDSDFSDNKISNANTLKRIESFCKEFKEIGEKLL